MDWFLLASASAIFSAAAAILEKKVLFRLDAVEFSFPISIFGLLFSIPFFFFIDYASLSPLHLAVLLIKSLLGALAFLCVMMSIKNLEISKALPFLALTPGFVAIFAFLFIGDNLKLSEWIGIFLLISGTYVLETKAHQKFFEPFVNLFTTKKYVYVLLALLLFTSTSILDRALLKQYKLPPITFMAFQQLFFAVIFMIIFFYKRKEINLKQNYSKDILILIASIALITVLYRYSQIVATKMAPVALVLSVKRISVLFAIIIGGRIFHEKNMMRKIIATIIIVAGTLLILEE